MGHKVSVVLLFLLATVTRAFAVPISVCAVEYGMSTCPHCIHLKETLTRMGVPLIFVDVDANRNDTEEYMGLYSVLVGGTYYVPFTIFIVNGSPKLAVVGDRDPAELLRLLRAAVSAEGLLLSYARGEERLIMDDRFINLTIATVMRRAPSPNIIMLPGAVATGEARLLTPFGTPLAAADILVSCPDGVQYHSTSDRDGRVQLTCTKANVTVLYWMGLPVNKTVEATIGESLTVGGIGRLTVRVRDALNRPIAGAAVSLIKGRVELVGETGLDGSITADLPDGEYFLTVSRSGKTFSAAISVVEGTTKIVEPTLDVVWTLGELAVGFRELAVAFGLLAVAAVAVFLLLRRSKGRPGGMQTGSTEGGKV